MGAQYSNETGLEDDVGPNVTPVTAGLRIIDNYIVPMASYHISKVFPVPVGKFNPKTGVIEGYYDFGLLMLNKLPNTQSIVLTTVAAKQKVAQFPAFPHEQKLERFGSRGNSQSALNSYVPLAEMPATTPFLNYDRLPIGSIHFMANAIWGDAAAASEADALLLPSDRDELINLYLQGGAWINTYDHLQNISKSKAMNLHKMVTGQCELSPSPRNVPNGMWLSHEIIIGGATERDFLNQRLSSIVPVVEGCPIK